MKPSDALARHRAALRELIQRHGFGELKLFGSVLTDTDTDDSDLDILVEDRPGTTLFTLVGLEHAASQLLSVRVSVVTLGFLPKKSRLHVREMAEPL